MADTINAPVRLTGTTSLTDIGNEVPTGKVRSVDLRCANITTSDVYVDVYLVDTANPSNNHYRCRNYPVTYLQTGGAPDLESGLLLTAGWKVQVRASANSAADFSLTSVDDDA
jgi:hypothetical protein